MKILFVYPMSEKSTGPKSVILSLSNNLIKKGHSVGIYTVNKYSKEIEKKLFYHGIKYYNTGNSFFPNILRDVPNYSKYQVIHLHSIFSYKIWMVARRLTKANIKYLITIHGNLMEAALKRSKTKKKIALAFAVKNLLNNASIIHALGYKEKQDILKITANNNITVLPNGIEKINESEAKISKDVDGYRKILFLGRIDVYHKGIDFLIQAIQNNIEELINSRVKVVFAGYFNKAKDEKYVASKIKETPKLNKVVEFVGEVTGVDKIKYFNECDIFVHTSRLEGMPIAVLEALSYRKPCLVTRETNMEDIIEKSQAGLVVELSTDNIGQGLMELVHLDYDKLSKMGDKGFDWCKNHLQWSVLINDYIQMYQDL